MSFTFERKVNYYETDRMGVVHHSNYIRFLEEARCRWLEGLNISMENLEKDGYTIPTLEVNVRFINYVTSGDIILITPKIIEYNGVRMTVDYEVINKQNKKIVVEAYTKHCFTNNFLKPINMKKNNVEINKIFVKLLQESDDK